MTDPLAMIRKAALDLPETDSGCRMASQAFSSRESNSRNSVTIIMAMEKPSFASESAVSMNSRC